MIELFKQIAELYGLMIKLFLQVVELFLFMTELFPIDDSAVVEVFLQLMWNVTYLCL
jgi:hypothetical protein